MGDFGGMEEHEVLLVGDGGSRTMSLWFLGFSLERVAEFMSERYSESRFWDSYKILR